MTYKNHESGSQVKETETLGGLGTLLWKTSIDAKVSAMRGGHPKKQYKNYCRYTFMTEEHRLHNNATINICLWKCVCKNMTVREYILGTLVRWGVLLKNGDIGAPALAKV